MGFPGQGGGSAGGGQGGGWAPVGKGGDSTGRLAARVKASSSEDQAGARRGDPWGRGVELVLLLGGKKKKTFRD